MVAKSARTCKPWLKPFFVGIYREIESFQGFLGGAKWISIHSMVGHSLGRVPWRGRLEQKKYHAPINQVEASVLRLWRRAPQKISKNNRISGFSYFTSPRSVHTLSRIPKWEMARRRADQWANQQMLSPLQGTNGQWPHKNKPQIWAVRVGSPAKSAGTAPY